MKEKIQEIIENISEKVSSQGGRAYLVGGCVRDALMHKAPKDYDIEVHNIDEKTLKSILSEVGDVIYIGKSFGVFHLTHTPIDVALPRSEKKSGDGHRGFDVTIDPHFGIEKAARRRDFTINALMQDPITGDIIDCFNGLDDLTRGVLRHVDAHGFPEDPLRVFRGAQFAARFDFRVAPETVALCQKIDTASLSGERVMAELSKALLSAEKPSLFFETLRAMQQLSPWFAEVAALMDVPQDARFHAEGDVYTHTMMVLDEAAKLRNQAEDALAFMLAALCHDFGKAVTTTKSDDGAIHAYGHEIEGLPRVEELLHRMTHEKKLTHRVKNLVELHMRPNALAWQGAKIKSTNHLFDKATLPNDLLLLSLADDLGRIAQTPGKSTEPFLRERLAVYNKTMAAPYVMGKDLIAAGLTPGADFSEILAYAHKLRLAGIEKASALRQTLGYAKKLRRKQRH